MTLMLENKHLRSFLRVLDLGGFSRASRSLNIAQPALSQHVRKIEDHLGVALLERRAHGVTPTQAGRRFAARARQILELVDNVERQFKVGQSALSGEVTIGMPGSVCPALATPLIVETAERFPHVKLIVSEMMSGDLADLLREGRIDLAVLFNVSETDDFTSKPIVQESLHLVGRPDDPLLSGSTIDASAMSDLPLVVTRPPHGLRLLIERWTNENMIDLRLEYEADAPSVLIAMASDGLCYSILSHSAVRPLVEAGRLASAQIVGPQIERTACLCSSKRLPSDRARDAVFTATTEIARAVVADDRWLGTSI